MAWLVLVVLIALPVAELTVIVGVAGEVGVLNTIGLLLLVSVVGVWLAQQAGLGVVKRIRQAQDEGRTPSREVADGALILLAAVLLVIPGFITDLMAIALLLPPTRAIVRTLALRRFERSANVVVVRGPQTRGEGVDPTEAEIWDVESWEEEPRSRRRGQIGGGP